MKNSYGIKLGELRAAWPVHPRTLNEDGTYDPDGLRLFIAMKQVEALANIGAALSRIANQLEFIKAERNGA